MRRFTETLIKAWVGDTGRAVMFLCALSLPALASAGVTSLCDTRKVDTPNFNIPAEELTIDLVDLGSKESIDLEITMETEPAAVTAPPNVDEMLNRIFDWSHNGKSEAIQGTSRATVLPIVELSSPAIRTETPEPVDDIDSGETQQRESTAPAVNTRIPGLSDEELRRYRRKMYRTDI